MRRHAGPLFLMVAVGYVALHVLAAVLDIPPGALFGALFQAAGFAVGAVAALAVLLQLLRR